MVAPTSKRRWLTVVEFAAAHGLSRNLVYEQAKLGQLLSCKVGGKVLVASGALDQLAEGRADGSDGH